jgi:hypothetical protein
LIFPEALPRNKRSYHVGNYNPEIDINQLLEKVGLELKLQHKQQQKKEEAGCPVELKINDPYNWTELSDTLKVAEQNANAGAEVTSMLHYRGIVRKVARFLGRVVIYLEGLSLYPKEILIVLFFIVCGLYLTVFGT